MGQPAIYNQLSTLLTCSRIIFFLSKLIPVELPKTHEKSHEPVWCTTMTVPIGAKASSTTRERNASIARPPAFRVTVASVIPHLPRPLFQPYLYFSHLSRWRKKKGTRNIMHMTKGGGGGGYGVWGEERKKQTQSGKVEKLLGNQARIAARNYHTKIDLALIKTLKRGFSSCYSRTMVSEGDLIYWWRFAEAESLH